MLNHGGKLKQVACEYGIAEDKWLDLSTGISPFSYPVPAIPTSIWQQLPQDDDELIKAAAMVYQASNLLVSSGSQSIIQQLPIYRQKLGYPDSKVWLPKQGYKEHQKAWAESGFNVCHYTDLPKANMLEKQDVVVVINPNNPTGQVYSQPNLSRLQHQLNALDGWLIIDEAFMDAIEHGQSMMSLSQLDNVFVLRSLGKFFGLAGARIGFVAAHELHLSALKEQLGPWQVNGPAQYVAKQALLDTEWQYQQKQQLQVLSNKLEQLLTNTFPINSVSGTWLFKTLYVPNAPVLYKQLCKLGVYVRLTDEQDALRFGIPTNKQFSKLSLLLNQLLDK